MDALLANLLPWALTALFILSSIPVEGTESPSFQDGTRGIDPQEDELSLTKGTSNYIDLDDEPESLHTGGQLEWSAPLTNATGHPLSTPALGDVDLENTMEIVVASTADKVFLLDNDGRYRWSEPYSEDAIDPIGQTEEMTGSDFEPPPFFSSVTVSDINSGEGPEIMVGVKNGPLFIGSNGIKQWKQGLTTGYYFSTFCITDLEGTWSEEKDDLEIIMTSNDESRRGWLEAFEIDGGAVLRAERQTFIRTPITGSSLVTSDIDGLPYRGTYEEPPGPEDELDTEIVCCYPGVPLSIFTRNGTSVYLNPDYDQTLIVEDPETLVFGTPAVGNITGGPECEIIVPYCKGYGNWTNWTGGIRCYNSTGSPMWDLPIGGKGSGVCTSPAVAVLDRGSEGPNRRIIVFGSDNGMVHAVDAEFHNILWEFDTGGRILSSPAICNIDNDGELELVIGSDSGKVFCFDLDSSDGVDEGVNYPGDGPLRDVLWVYNATVPIGISSPVVADIDLDKQLEVVIGDSNGTLYCISAGGSSLKGQKDWPEFHNDHNRTGFYDPLVTFGVDLYAKKDLAGKSETVVKRITPGSFVTYNITVENTGNGITTANRDRIDVSIEPSSVPEGWFAWLDVPPDRGNDNPGYVRLASQEKVNLTLYVYAPWEDEPGTMARINVTAISSGDPRAEDLLTTISVLDLNIDHDLYFNNLPSTDMLDPLVGRKWEKIYPGEEREFQITISNKGSLNDSYVLELSRPPIEAGWNWSFSDTGTLNRTVHLTAPRLVPLWGGISKVIYNVTVKAPTEYFGPSLVPMELKATSQLSLTPHWDKIVKRDEMVLQFIGQSLLELSFLEDPFYVMPGERAEVTLEMKDIGPTGQVRVNLSHTPIDNWTIEHRSGPLIVQDNGTEEVVLILEAPGTVKLRETYYLWMDLEIDGEYLTELSLKIVIGMRDGFMVGPSSLDLTAMEGDQLELELELSSLCYGPVDVMLGLNITHGNWSVVYRDRSEELLESVHLSNWSERTIIASVLVPFGAGSGYHLLELRLNGTKERSPTLIVPVHVMVITYDGNESRPGVDIRTRDGDGPLSLKLEVDEAEDIWVRISNTGNLRESIAISVEVIEGEAPGDGWGLELKSIGPEDTEMPKQVQKDLRVPISLDGIGPDEMLVPSGGIFDGLYLTLIMESTSDAWLHLVLKGPARDHPYTVPSTFWDVRCDVVGYDVSDHLPIRLDPLYPDLVITGGINITGPHGTVYRSGEVLSVSFVLENQGNVTAFDFKVAFWLDENLTESQDIVILDLNGNQRLMTFQFRTEPGMHMVRIEIDPDNSVIESADQFIDGGKNDNNVHVRTITVKDVKDDDGSDDMVMLIFGLSVLVVFLVICVTIYIYLKGRRNGDVPAEE